MATRYVIVGAGPAGQNAIETIRALDADADISLVCDEPAYARMVLPYFVEGKVADVSVRTGDDDWFKQLKVDAHFGQQVASVDTRAAQVALEDCRLTAPVSGYIEQRFLDPHEVATAQSPVVVLTQLDSVKVKANVADRALPFIEIDGPASVRSSAWPGRIFEGRIARVAMAADPQTHTLPIEVEIDNPDLALRPELVVEVAVPIVSQRSSYLAMLTFHGLVWCGATRFSTTALPALNQQVRTSRPGTGVVRIPVTPALSLLALRG